MFIRSSCFQVAKEPSKDYPWPVIRLAELYLSYAEACIAYNKDGYLEKGMVKLDRIRERAGLLSVKDSWKNAKIRLSVMREMVA